jgi:hypothetical protein
MIEAVSKIVTAFKRIMEGEIHFLLTLRILIAMEI